MHQDNHNQPKMFTIVAKQKDASGTTLEEIHGVYDISSPTARLIMQRTMRELKRQGLDVEPKQIPNNSKTIEIQYKDIPA